MRSYKLFGFILIFGIALDRLTKMLLEHEEAFRIWGDFVGFRVVYNSGIAFSMPIPSLPLKIITIALTIILGYFYLTKIHSTASRYVQVWYAFVLSGAISHMFDRVVYGRVIDFIDVKYFAIFNVADIMISVWAALLILNHFLDARHTKRNVGTGSLLTAKNR